MPIGGLIAGIGDFGVEALVTQAELAKDSAESSASTATTSANQASASATTATTQAGIATTKAGEASTSATNATTSANQAQQSAWNAQDSADSASGNANITAEYLAQSSSNAASAAASAQLVGNVVNRELQILPVKAGSAMNIGTPVYISSADGTNIIVSPASSATEATSSKVIGLLMQTLANNGIGSVVTGGKLAGLNTSTATLGDAVWLGSTAGTLIYGLTNKPKAPQHLVFLGVVSRVHATNGEITVKVQNGFEMDEIHNYLESNLQDGDTIQYDSVSGLYKNSHINIFEGKNKYNSSKNRVGFIQDTTYDLINTGGQGLSSISSGLQSVLPNTTYTLSNVALNNIKTYGVDRVALSGISVSGTSKTFTTASNVYFIEYTLRFNGGTDYTSLAQLELGSVSTAYIAYYKGITGISGVDQYAKKIFYNNEYYTLSEWVALQGGWNSFQLENSSDSDNLFNKDTCSQAFITYSDGSIVTTGSQATASLLSDFIYVKPSTQYFISGRIASAGTNGVKYFDANKNPINTPPSGVNWGAGALNGVYTTTVDTYYIKICVKFNGVGSSENVMVNEGSVQLPFVSFVSAYVIKKINNIPFRDLSRLTYRIAQQNISINNEITYNQLNENFGLFSTQQFYISATSNYITAETDSYLLGLGITNNITLNSGVMLSSGRRDLYAYVNLGKIIDAKYVQVAFFIKTDNPTKFDLTTCYVANSIGSFSQRTAISTVITNVGTNLYKVVKTFLAPSTGSWTGCFIGSSLTNGGTNNTDTISMSGFYATVSDTDCSSIELVQIVLPTIFKKMFDLKKSIPSNAIASRLTSRRYTALGDSITYGHGVGATNTYAYYVASRNGMSYTSLGISGTCLALDSNASGLSMCNPTRYLTIPSNTEYITVFGGTNDYTANVPIGSDTDNTSATFKGALNILCSGLLTNYPTAKIVFITPLNHRSNAGMLPYVDAINTICANYSIPVLDLYRKSGILPLNTASRTAFMYSSDGINYNDYQHPSVAGHTKLSYQLEAFLNTL